MQVFEFYKNELGPLVEAAKKDLPKFLTVERELKGLSLPEGMIILDLETTGLEPHEHELVSYGIVRGNKAKVVIRVTGENYELADLLERELENVETIGAFYYSFEESWLEEHVYSFDVEKYSWCELKTQRGRLIDIMPFSFGDTNNGADVPRLWQDWLETNNFESLAAIIHHNMADILREAFLWALIENGAFNRGGNDYD